jgi:hypothetical protein
MASLRMGDQNFLSRAPPCFGRHVKPLVPAAFAVVSTQQSALGPRGGLWPVLLVGNPLGKPVPAVGTLIGWWWVFIQFDGPAVSSLGVRSRKLSNVRKGQSPDGWQKFYIFQLPRASEGTLSCWSRLHLQSLAPTPVSGMVDVRQNNCRIFITTWWNTCCTEST